MAEQLTLAIKLRDDTTFANFLVGENQQLCTQLQQDISIEPGGQFFYLWGTHGCGLTHLLQACCHSASQHQRTSFYLPLHERAFLAPQILESLENMSLVCIDDIDCIADSAQWQEAIFHFYNRIINQNSFLIISGRVPPTDLKFQLADLRSRLSAGLTFHVAGLNKEDLIAALQLRCQNRGIPLTLEVAKFIVNSCENLPERVFLLLDELDRVSLAHQRKITIPFVKSVLQK